MHELIARARAFAHGDLGVADGIRLRFVGGVPASETHSPASIAAVRAAGQAAAVPHMGAHALGAAAYAAKAAALVAPDRADAASDEIRWQFGNMAPEIRAALRTLPPVGENASGPLGRGLLATGALGRNVGALQALLTRSEEALRSTEHQRLQ